MTTRLKNPLSTSAIRLTLVALCTVTIIATLLLLSGCGKDDEGASEPDNSSEQAGAVEMTGEDILSALEEAYGTETWFGHINEIQVEQMLLAKVAVVNTDLASDPGEPYDLAAQIGNAVTEIAAESVPNARIIAGNGVLISGASIGSSAVDVLDLPAAPYDVDSLTGWIDDVFGESGEQWFDHITSIEISDDFPGWSSTVLVVHTDLEGGSAEENQEIARMMGMAIDMSGQTLAQNYGVVDIDETAILTGDIPTASFAY